jgi:hypothetical protein
MGAETDAILTLFACHPARTRGFPMRHVSCFIRMVRLVLLGLVVTWCASLVRLLKSTRTPAMVATTAPGRRRAR